MYIVIAKTYTRLTVTMPF